MDEHHHNLYFKDIDYNTDTSFHWAALENSFIMAMKPVYEATLEAILGAPTTQHISSSSVE